MTVCAREVHEKLKLDRRAYEQATYLVGWQDDGCGGEYEMRNCACHSTLSDGTTRPRPIQQLAA